MKVPPQKCVLNNCTFLYGVTLPTARDSTLAADAHLANQERERRGGPVPLHLQRHHRPQTAH